MPNTLTEWVLALLPAIVIGFSALTVAVASWRASRRRKKGLPLPGVYPGSAQHQADLTSTYQQPADDSSVRASAAESAGLRADDASHYRHPHHP